jgi:hypothetical protein
MKHSNFENELNEIRRRAVQELKEALAAHNGRYDFTQFEFTPIVDNEKVCEARMFTGEVFIETEERHLDTEDLTIEDILQLTAFVAETDDVEDVSGVYPVPVTWVDRDDIENEGFDASDVTQEKLNRIAEIMQEYSCLPTQYDIRTSDLYAACTKVCLKQKGD